MRVEGGAPNPSALDRIAGAAGAVLLVDTRAIAANWRRLADRVTPARCGAALKADAYGLGLAPVATALWRAGCRQFFVAQAEEGVALRRVLPMAEIAVLHGVQSETVAAVAAAGLVPVLNTLDEIDRWRGAAVRAGRPLPCMVHLDTGMNRLGLSAPEASRLAGEPGRLDRLEVRAWMTHFACAEMPDHPLTGQQVARFRDLVGDLPKAPVSLANSAAIFRDRSCHGDIVRPGAALFGINPTPGSANPMAPAVRLMTRILQVRRVDRGESVGYGATHSVGRDTELACISIGYADGFRRCLSGSGQVAVAGRLAPVVGRVSMDLVTVDVTDLPEPGCRAGDWVELLGPDRPIDMVAREAGTVGYEILTGLGGRLRRHYMGGRHRRWRCRGYPGG